MKKSRIALALSFLAGAVVALTFNQVLLAQDSSPAETLQVGDTTFVYIASLNDAAANDEFRRNVQIMQARRNQGINLARAVQAATSMEQRNAFQAQLDEINERLTADNNVMVQTYGYSLLRRYTQVIEVSHLYLELTPEEADRVNN